MMNDPHPDAKGKTGNGNFADFLAPGNELSGGVMLRGSMFFLLVSVLVIPGG